MNSDLSPKALMDEKSLWDIYKKSRRIPFNRFNLWSSLLVFVLVGLQYCFIGEGLPQKLEIVRGFASSALGIVVSVLGFLIAGFTIFATISQPDMLVAMSRHRAESGLSYLKHNFFMFIRVFVYYLTYTVLCLLVVVFAVKGGVLHRVVSLSPIHREIYEWFVGAAYVLLYGGFFFLLMQLKSFIFNVYHSVMTAIRWKALQ